MISDRVTVVLEAQTQKYLADLNKSEQTFKKVSGTLKSEAAASGAALTVMANNAQTSFARVGNAANSMNIGNIAAQFQDIGVTAAMGMNPMLIALQQGTQLSAVLNQSVTAGVSPVRMLGQAFLQVINPISLATIATVALGTAAVQYFMTLLNDGQASEEVLKRQNDAVEALADKWGDLVPAIQEYIDKQREAQGQQQVDDAEALLINEAWSDVRDTFGQAMAEYVSLQTVLRDLGGADEQANQLRDAWQDLTRGIEDGTVSSEQNSRVTAALAALMRTTGSPAVSEFAAVWRDLSVAISQASAAAAAARADAAGIAEGSVQTEALDRFISSQNELNAMTREELSLHNEIARVRSEASRAGVDNIPDIEAERIATERLSAEERRREELKAQRTSSNAGVKAISELEREREAVLDLIEALQFENSLIGMTNEERAVAVTLRQAGSAATEAQRQQIEALVIATEREREAFQFLQEQMRSLDDLTRDTLQGMVQDLIAGKDAADVLNNALSNVASRLIDIGMNFLFRGSPLGFLFGGRGFADGGYTGAGGKYQPAGIVHGGEYVFSKEAVQRAGVGNLDAMHRSLKGYANGGLVAPGVPSMGMGGGLGQPISILLQVQEGAAFETRVLEVSGPASVEVSRQSVTGYDRNMPSTMSNYDARYR